MSALHLESRPDSVGVLTIDQPGSRANVLTQELWAELAIAFTTLAAQTSLRGLVIASAKPGIFIAGADLKLLADAEPNDPAVRAFIDQGLRVLEQLETLPFPTCAAIDGAALGGGLEVALACDYRVCGTNPKVQLGLPEVKLGLIPGWGGTQRLPRIIGLVTAAELLTTGEPINGERAASIGLVEMVASADLLNAAIRCCTERTPDRTVKQQPLTEWMEPHAPRDTTAAVRELDRLRDEASRLPLAAAIARETEAFLRLAGSEASKRCIADFFARRAKPK